MSNAAAVDVLTRQVLLLMEKKEFFLKLVTKHHNCYSYSARGGIWRIATWAVAQYNNALLSYWQHTSCKKGLHVFLALNSEISFWNLMQKSIPLLSASKKHWRLCTKLRQIDWHLLYLDPPFFGWTISLNNACTAWANSETLLWLSQLGYLDFIVTKTNSAYSEN
jgi:hypothetical protein